MLDDSTPRRSGPSDDLVMWTVYDRPKDFPNNFVARKWLIDHEGHAISTGNLMVCHDLAMIHFQLTNMGLHRIERDRNDDACIVESWV